MYKRQEEGRYDFSWLDRAVSLLADYGIKTVLGTPSAAPPAWMINRYPDILPVDREGKVRGFGGRHHDCQSNPVYRAMIRRMVTAMAEHYGGNTNVIGWQPDNELGNSHQDLCMCDHCRSCLLYTSCAYNNDIIFFHVHPPVYSRTVAYCLLRVRNTHKIITDIKYNVKLFILIYQ